MMRKIWVAYLAMLAITALMPVQASAADSAPSPADTASLLAIGNDDRILGNRDAPITIVEYASLTCPHCAHFTNEILPEIKKEWIDTGKAKLVLRDFPLDNEAVRAAMIARCAPPDRFYAFIDTFFADQANWATASDFQAALTRLAELGGMNKDAVDKCISNTALENKILDSRLIASKQLDVNATPTFFINGTKFTGEPTAKDFAASLETAFAQISPGQPAPATKQGKPATAQSTPVATEQNPAAAQATPGPVQAASAAAQATSKAAQTTPIDAGNPRAATIWDRVQGWFLGLFGSHS
jgi:protein-disulfide isomerase